MARMLHLNWTSQAPVGFPTLSESFFFYRPGASGPWLNLDIHSVYAYYKNEPYPCKTTLFDRLHSKNEGGGFVFKLHGKLLSLFLKGIYHV
jgi:hypothetical protein